MATEWMFFQRDKQTKDSLWSFLCLPCCQHYGIISSCLIKHSSLGFGNPVQGRSRQSVSVFRVHMFEWVVNSLSDLNRAALARQEILPSSPVAFLSWWASGLHPEAGNNGAFWKHWPSHVNIHYLIRHCAELSELEKVAVKKRKKTKINWFSSAYEK